MLTKPVDRVVIALQYAELSDKPYHSRFVALKWLLNSPDWDKGFKSTSRLEISSLFETDHRSTKSQHRTHSILARFISAMETY